MKFSLSQNSFSITGLCISVIEIRRVSLFPLPARRMEHERSPLICASLSHLSRSMQMQQPSSGEMFLRMKILQMDPQLGRLGREDY